MKINLHHIKIRDLVAGYEDNDESGVKAYSGRLDVRPPYQREFVYKDKQRDAVIDTVQKNFPLNVMYWVKTGEDSYEVLDGQQRTISICQYFNNEFSLNFMGFANLPTDRQNQFLDYELMVYICEGTDSEKLDWFKIINIAGEKLTDQELRNSVYTGQWLADAKRYFSKTSGPAYALGDKLLKGVPNRQEYLETVLSWINNGEIENYMAQHQHDKNANELWTYYQAVINWVNMLFPAKYYRKEMKGQPWGELYNSYHGNSYDAEEFEAEIKRLIQDDEVQKHGGIYPYLFDHQEKHLNLRAFTDSQKRKKYEEQKGICPICHNHFEYKYMEGDHITPWIEGGKTNFENLQMLCKNCNRRKSSN
ncbi:TPA: HNH endonuclease family protein [Streptococcus suis]